VGSLVGMTRQHDRGSRLLRLAESDNPTECDRSISMTECDRSISPQNATGQKKGEHPMMLPYGSALWA